MPQVSRRQFLQLSGISLLGHVAGFERLEAPSTTFFYGRALEAAPVHPLPQSSIPSTSHLWPDSISRISSAGDSWYRIVNGYVQREMMQPIQQKPVQQPIQPISLPFWAEVTAPLAPVYAWCAADAPLAARVGYGGVLQIVDQLNGSSLWYGVADQNDTFTGWSQAVHWQPIHSRMQPLPGLEIDLDQGTRQIRITQQGQALMQASFAAGRDIPAGCYSITQANPGGLPSPAAGQVGGAWQLNVGDTIEISGVYWHNRFGDSVPGPDVQLPPALARWLYEHVDTSSCVNVYG